MINEFGEKAIWEVFKTVSCRLYIYLESDETVITEHTLNWFEPTFHFIIHVAKELRVLNLHKQVMDQVPLASDHQPVLSIDTDPLPDNGSWTPWFPERTRWRVLSLLTYPEKGWKPQRPNGEGGTHDIIDIKMHMIWASWILGPVELNAMGYSDSYWYGTEIRQYFGGRVRKMATRLVIN